MIEAWLIGKIGARAFKLLPYLALLAGLVAAAWAVRNWHVHAVNAAYTRGSDEQVAADGRAVTRAFVAANAAQDKLIAKLTADQSIISGKAEHDLSAANDDIDRRAAELRRLRAQAQAAAGRAVDGSAVAVPGAASLVDDAACTKAGGVPFDAALLMATDAEHDAAKLRGLQGWLAEQRDAWPAK